MRHILITGGNGFIGSHLVDRLSASGKDEVVTFDLYPRAYEPLPEGATFIQGNLNNVDLVRRVIIDRGVEIIYHAAWTSIHETSIKDPTADIEHNLVPMVRLLEVCREGGVKRVIFISSGGTVYGIPRSFPVREDHPTNPISAYGITKLAAEKYLQMYCHLYGLEYVIFRPSVPYGPRQNPRRRQGAVSVFVYHALRGEPVTIWGDGEVLRDFFYIEDMCEAFLRVMDKPAVPGAIFNLAGSRGYTLNQLVSVIEETLGVNLDVQYQAARKFDVPQLRLDTSAAAEVLNWQPTTPLPEGVRQTAAWIQKWMD